MKNIYKALSDFQSEVPNIKKNSTGYGYKFADLDEINAIIKPLFKKYGLGYVQPIEGSTIRTIIFHVESGETIESAANIPQGVQLAKMNDFQVLGSAITYLRRYSLSSMLGLITDEDADASGEQIKMSPKERADSRQKVWEDGTLARAKTKINQMLTERGYDTAVSKLAFINSVLKKEVITTEEDCDEVADALENEDE